MKSKRWFYLYREETFVKIVISSCLFLSTFCLKAADEKTIPVFQPGFQGYAIFSDIRTTNVMTMKSGVKSRSLTNHRLVPENSEYWSLRKSSAYWFPTKEKCKNKKNFPIALWADIHEGSSQSGNSNNNDSEKSAEIKSALKDKSFLIEYKRKSKDGKFELHSDKDLLIPLGEVVRFRARKSATDIIEAFWTLKSSKGKLEIEEEKLKEFEISSTLDASKYLLYASNEELADRMTFTSVGVSSLSCGKVKSPSKDDNGNTTNGIVCAERQKNLTITATPMPLTKKNSSSPTPRTKKNSSSPTSRTKKKFFFANVPD